MARAAAEGASSWWRKWQPYKKTPAFIEGLESRLLLSNSYILIPLGTLGGSDSGATDINASGQVVGYATTNDVTHAFLYDGTMHDLGTFGGADSSSSAINDNGLIVGTAYTSGNIPWHAFLYDGTMNDLGTLGGDSSWANDINSSGQYVGGVYTIDAVAGFAYFYDGTTMHNLGTLGGSLSYATALNDSGQVVGKAYTSETERAFFYDGTTMYDLGTLGGASSYATKINNSGQIVGAAYTSTTEHAFFYDGATMYDLGTLGGTTSYATDINDHGQIVGQAYTSGDAAAHAFYYDGTMHDLNDLVPPGSGWIISIATAINDNGWITAISSNPAVNNGADQAILLKPSVQLFATGTGAGGGPHVKVYNSDGSDRFNFMAYDGGFRGGVRVATGDVTGDGVDDIVTAAGPGGGPHVKVFDGVTGQEIISFFPYDGNFRGGVFIAVGDVNGDGLADIITGAGATGGPHVQVYSGVTLQLLHNFMTFDGHFAGGVNVAAGDVNGDGLADIITAAGAGGGPHVMVYAGGSLQVLQSFMAFDGGFRGGVNLAVGDTNGDGKADIITGAGGGGGPHVIVYSGATFQVLQSFMAYDGGFRGGVTVAVVDADGDGKADIITGAGAGGGPHVMIYKGTNRNPLKSLFPYDGGFRGGVWVG